MRLLVWHSSVNWIISFPFRKKIINICRLNWQRFPVLNSGQFLILPVTVILFSAGLCLRRELTEAIVAELKSQQIFAGNFYWFEHNWHYIRKWDHLKTEKTLNRLNEGQSKAIKKLDTQDFRKSDAIMGSCISTAIGLSWTDEQLKEKANLLAAAIKKVLANASPPAYYSQQASLA